MADSKRAFDALVIRAGAGAFVRPRASLTSAIAPWSWNRVTGSPIMLLKGRK